jgi:hypothetical protein
MKRLGLLTLVQGCAQPADPPDVVTLVEAAPAGDRMVVTAAGVYALTFGRDGTVRLPETLEIQGAHPHGNVLGIDYCPLESLMGVATFPGAAAIGGETLAAGGTSTSFLELGGPVIARVRVDYSVPYLCQNAQHLSGSSVFTMFPDGRIQRQDTVTSSDTDLTPATDCGCNHVMTGASGTGYFFTSFYAFDTTATIDPARGLMPDACATWNDLTIGMRWLDSSNTRVSPNGKPSFVLDMLTSSEDNFPVVTMTHRSAMMIASGAPAPACSDVLARLDLPGISVAGSSKNVDGDGIYRDGEKHTGPVEIRASVAVPPFAVSLTIGDHAGVASTVAHDGRWYATQPDADQGTNEGMTLFWFDHGLAAGEVVTVTPR